ncbi:DUF6284 family protein [Streptomyces sp. NPDC057681]|uniref:DUF6284 family protein n=1 Tax=Streptomyces sp. NPDC057681 TaxID=3346209 RepID=UPI0036B4F0B6
MKHIVTVQDAVTAFSPFMEPTDAELDAIEQEAPLIDAELELLDVQIALLDRKVTAFDERWVRRAANKVLAARCEVANRLGEVREGDAA